MTPEGANLLLCAVGSPVLPPVAAFEYRFAIAADCYNPSVDVNQDGIVDPDDLADYISAYFQPC